MFIPTFSWGVWCGLSGVGLVDLPHRVRVIHTICTSFHFNYFTVRKMNYTQCPFKSHQSEFLHKPAPPAPIETTADDKPFAGDNYMDYLKVSYTSLQILFLALCPA